jgi:hypothetical protein
MSTATIEAVLASRGTIEAALKRVPIDASLTSESVPWEALRAVFAAFEDIPAVGLPRTTKILHKKRPALVPILDSVLEQYLVTNHDVGSQQRLADRGVALTRAFREELLENEDALRLLRAALSSQGIELTECRLLDIILWAYSGTYAPVWRRRRGMAASSSKRPGTGPIVVPPPLVAFVDNDTGYVSWIGQNPNGYVLNANRRPNAGYLKLHRASCPRISGDDGRRWTVQYAKVWAPTTLAIDSWTTSTLGVQPDRCPFCQP